MNDSAPPDGGLADDVPVLMRRLLPIPSVLLGVLLVVTGPLASAAPWGGRDATGDVERFRTEGDLPEEGCPESVEETSPGDVSRDIERLQVFHRRSDVRLVATFRDLRRRGSHSSTFFIRTPRGDWELSVHRWGRKGALDSFFNRAPDYAAIEDTLSDVECEVVTIGGASSACARLVVDLDVDSDTVTAVVPRTCLRDPAWVQAGLWVYGDRGGSDPWSYWDRWAPVGSTDDASFVPPLSPRVRR